MLTNNELQSEEGEADPSSLSCPELAAGDDAGWVPKQSRTCEDVPTKSETGSTPSSRSVLSTAFTVATHVGSSPMLSVFGVARKNRHRRKPRFLSVRFIRSTFRLYISPNVPLATAETWRVNPNRVVDWNHVRRVDVLTHKAMDQLPCPICLDTEFVAPRLTRCGHLFCFPCIIRCCIDLKSMCYIPQAKCPVCGQIIEMESLKAARLQQVTAPQPGMFAQFCLMCRDPESTHVAVAGLLCSQDVEPKEELSLQQLGFCNSTDPTAYFQRIVILDRSDATLEHDAESLDAYRRTLLDSSDVDPDVLEAVDVCLILTRQEMEDHCPASQGSGYYRAVDKSPKFQGPLAYHVLYNYTTYAPEALERQLRDRSASRPDLDLLRNKVAFYQIIDGQFCFLDDLCYQCLLDHATRLNDPASSPPLQPSTEERDNQRAKGLQSYTSEATQWLPLVLSDVKITWVEELRVDHHFKVLYPKLGHLPPTSTVHIVEIDVRSLVSSSVWSFYAPKFQKRRAERFAALRRDLHANRPACKPPRSSGQRSLYDSIPAGFFDTTPTVSAEDIPYLNTAAADSETLSAGTACFPPLEPAGLSGNEGSVGSGDRRPADRPADQPDDLGRLAVRAPDSRTVHAARSKNAHSWAQHLLLTTQPPAEPFPTLDDSVSGIRRPCFGRKSRD